MHGQKLGKNTGSCPILAKTVWMDIQDIVGKARLWPREVRQLFWQKNPSHFDRLIVAAFVYINGLNLVIFIDWLQCISEPEPIKSHYRRVLTYMEEGRYGRSLYSWNVSNGHHEYLDGTIQTYSRQ